MKVVILEDEQRAAHRLQLLIEKLAPEMEIVGVFESVRDAVKFFKSDSDIALVFADIQLVDGLSFEVFSQVEINCPIIFTTAYDQYAIEAFKTNGIDYLLKPIEEARLQQALDKLKTIQKPLALDQLATLMTAIQKPSFKNRFMIKVGDKIKSIESDKIFAFYSMEKASFLFTDEQRSYVIDYSLENLERLIDPSKFFKINRKFMVSHQACADILSWSNSRLRLKIDGLDEEIIVARERVAEFKNWLDS
ncbi:MAG: response regulator transcription factor [Bacteroidetes bacterium]|nr:response regulator transcription factor [Bacteroidota bacterium]